jgi:hypothetical protein
MWGGLMAVTVKKDFLGHNAAELRGNLMFLRDILPPSSVSRASQARNQQIRGQVAKCNVHAHIGFCYY